MFDMLLGASFNAYLTSHCIQFKDFIGQKWHIADVCDFLLHLSPKNRHKYEVLQE